MFQEKKNNSSLAARMRSYTVCYVCDCNNSFFYNDQRTETVLDRPKRSQPIIPSFEERPKLFTAI